MSPTRHPQLDEVAKTERQGPWLAATSSSTGSESKLRCSIVSDPADARQREAGTVEAGPDDRIATDRLILEPLGLSHANEMVAVLADDRLYEYIGGHAPSLEVLADRYRHQIRGPGPDDERWFNWIVRRTDTGAAVGYVQATVVDGRAVVAWLVGVDHQGHGFAGEAAEAMLSRLSQHGVGELSAHVAVDHVASARVAERLGLERTGVIDDDGEEVWSNAHWAGPLEAR